MSCHQGPEIKNLSEVLVTYSLGVFISRYHPDSHSHLSQKAKGTMVTLQCCPSQVLVMFAYLLTSGRRINCKWQSGVPGCLPREGKHQDSKMPWYCLHSPLLQQEQSLRAACGVASPRPGWWWGARSQKSMG